MKKILLLLFVSVIPFFLFGQIDNILAKAHKHKIGIYKIADTGNYKIFKINLNFAKPNFSTDNVLLKQLKKQEITRVDYVYTKYKLVDTFDQKRLNYQRLKNLYKNFPELFDYNLIEWNFFKQEAYNKLTEAQKAFHGFVFYCKKTDSIEMMLERKKEIDSVRSIIEKLTFDSSMTYSYDIEKRTMYLPRLKWKREKGILYKKKSIWNRKKIIIRDTLSVDTSIVFKGNFFYYKDTAIIHLLNRHKNWKYENAVVVTDVTGSMVPYTTQVLFWAKKYYSHNRKLRFVFFNDGDAHPDGPIGRSYGYYSVNKNAFEPILDTLIYTMEKGYGGLGPENDIEAMLYAQKRFPEAEFIILIADNNAPVRDMQLLNKLQKPVKIILCGAQYGINAQYLTIAYKTGGGVYTIDQDIENLDKYKNGNILKIKDKKFKLKNGKFYEY